MMSELKGPDGKFLGLSVVAAAVAFIVAFKVVRAVATGDLGLLLGSIIATYAGVAVPWIVVRTLSSAKKAERPAGSAA